jgi:cell division protein FtsX
METIIVKPKNPEQAKVVLEVLKKLKVKTEVYPDRTKKEILNGIEQGAKEAAEYFQGKRKLRSAKEFLNEL